VTGGPDGKVTCWNKNKAHTIKPGTPDESGAEFSMHVKDLRAMKLVARDEATQTMVCAVDAPRDALFRLKEWRLVTAGGDGIIRESVLNWDDPDDVTFTPSAIEDTGPFTLGEPGEPDVPSVISLDCLDGCIVAGDDRNDIWEVDADPKVMVEGQSGHVSGACAENAHRLFAPFDAENASFYQDRLGTNIDGKQDSNSEMRLFAGLAPHPFRANIYCTACGDGSVYVWDSALRACLRSFQITRGINSRGPGVQNAPRGNDNLKAVGRTTMHAGELLCPKVCCFSKQGDLFAIGTGGDHGGVVGMEEHPDKGGVLQVFAVAPEMFTPAELDDDGGEGEGGDGKQQQAGGGGGEWAPRKIWEHHESEEGIEAICFSPDGTLFAAADRDNFINIYDVGDNFKRVGKCVGHSSAVTQVRKRNAFFPAILC
jgi:WD40 repeat protein